MSQEGHFVFDCCRLVGHSDDGVKINVQGRLEKQISEDSQNFYTVKVVEHCKSQNHGTFWP